MQPARLSDVYAASRKAELERRAAAAATKPVSSWMISRLPPNHPLVKRAQWATINPGVPYPDDSPPGGSAA